MLRTSSVSNDFRHGVNLDASRDLRARRAGGV
jgi:hypothetical protein